MKIGFESAVKQTPEYIPGQINGQVGKTENRSAAKLDINGMYTDGNAYGSKGKTGADLMQEAEAVDVTTARKFMTVMSNTMSGEDFKKAMEDGFDFSDMSGEESVTILDHIKAEMINAGIVVEGYNDDASNAAIEELTGKTISKEDIATLLKEADLPDSEDNVKQIMEAINMLAGIDGLPDGSIKYMVANDIEPTIGNIYTARYSAMDDGSAQPKGYYAQDMSGYYAKKAEAADLTNIEEQIEAAIEKMNLPKEDIDEAVKDAKWLIEKGLPLTEEKLSEYESIKKIEFPVSVDLIVRSSIEAILDGLNAKDANLSRETGDIYSKAYKDQKAILESSLSREYSRLMLTIDANIRLQKQGISLETNSIEEVIDALKLEDENLKKMFFGEGNIEELNGKAELYRTTREIVNELPSLPVACVGRVIADGEEYNLNNIHHSAKNLESAYNAAKDTYEAVGTEVRTDLGDSITKAFRNVDDILKSLNMEVNSENERAVRILGYNSMLINEEEIKKIVKADESLQKVIKELTPAKTLGLIRDGVNPLGLSISELVEKLEEMDFDPKRDNQKYSKFLYQLDKNGEISKEEKESFIGIYRLVNRLEKTDHAAIGRLLDSDMDITFGNLLTAMRSSKKTFDVDIDDNFGLLEETVKKGSSISDQIEAAFKMQVSEESYKESEEEYIRESYDEQKQIFETGEKLVNDLILNGVDVTGANVEALQEFMNNPNGLFRNIRNYAGRADSKLSDNESKILDHIDKAFAEYRDSLDSMEDAKTEYENLISNLNDTLSRISDLVYEDRIDVKNMSLIYKQLSFVNESKNSENYHIPVSVNDNVVDMNIKFVHGKETGLIKASMEIADSQNVGAQIRLSNGNIEAVLLCENRECLDDTANIGKTFINKMTELGYENTVVRTVIGNPKTSGKLLSENVDNNNETYEAKDLYKIAKSFIESVETTR